MREASILSNGHQDYVSHCLCMSIFDTNKQTAANCHSKFCWYPGNIWKVIVWWLYAPIRYHCLRQWFSASGGVTGVPMYLPNFVSSVAVRHHHIIQSRYVSKLWDNRSDILQASWQHCCWGACKVSELSWKPKSPYLETLEVCIYTILPPSE